MSLISYIKETRGELKHVSWPSRQQAIFYAVMVVVVSLGLSLFLGAFDFLFRFLIEKFIV